MRSLTAALAIAVLTGGTVIAPPVVVRAAPSVICAISKPAADSARRAMKNSLQPGAQSRPAENIDIADFIVAPHLKVTRADVARLHAITKQHQQTTMTAMARWVVVPRSHKASNFDFVNETPPLKQVGPPFPIQLHPPTPDVMSSLTLEVQGDSSALKLTHPNINDVISASIGDGPIAQAVPIGPKTFHEGDIVSVSGTVLSFKCEPDGDQHIDLGDDSNDPRNGCVVVEIPNPSAISGNAALKSAVSRANADGASILKTGGKVTVTGQLFYDAHHAPNSRGIGFCATTLWEVHPITAIAPG